MMFEPNHYHRRFRRNNIIHHVLGSAALAILVLFALTASSMSVCEYHTCTPNCICDNRYDDICAMEYGNYGWMVPEGTEDYVYKLMRPDVSSSNSSSDFYVCRQWRKDLPRLVLTLCLQYCNFVSSFYNTQTLPMYACMHVFIHSPRSVTMRSNPPGCAGTTTTGSRESEMASGRSWPSKRTDSLGRCISRSIPTTSPIAA
jgi:hypothetical protein